MADIRRMIAAGADKVSVNSAAVANPQLITDAAAAFGGQAILCAIGTRRVAPTTRTSGKSTCTAGARPRASTRWSGPPRPPAGRGPTRLPAWTATAAKTASTAR
ncbi:MAG: HisA/HisF-related TIM barrel protein [Senegalimassilia faecalis]